MAREVWSNKPLLESLTTILPSEEDKYSDIPGWEGGYMQDTSMAVLLYMPEGKGRGATEVWFPKSHLRIAEDRQSIYASNWILHQKGLD